MLETYFVIAFFNVVVSVNGPWPGGKEACEADRAKTMVELDKRWAEGIELPPVRDVPGIPDGSIITQGDVEILCFQSATRPALLERLDGI